MSGLKLCLVKILGKEIVDNIVDENNLQLLSTMFGDNAEAASKVVENKVKELDVSFFTEKGYSSAEEYLKAEKKAAKILVSLYKEATNMFGCKIMSEEVISWTKLSAAAELFNYRKSGDRQPIIDCIKGMAIAEKGAEFVEKEIESEKSAKEKAVVHVKEEHLSVEKRALMAEIKKEAVEENVDKLSKKAEELLSAPIDDNNFEEVNEAVEDKEAAEKELEGLKEKAEHLSKKVEEKSARKAAKNGVETEMSKNAKAVSKSPVKGYKKLEEAVDTSEVEVRVKSDELVKAKEELANNTDDSMKEALVSIVEKTADELTEATAKLSAAKNSLNIVEKSFGLNSTKISEIEEEQKKLKESLTGGSMGSDVVQLVKAAWEEDESENFNFLAGVFGYDWRELKSHLEKYGVDFSDSDELELRERVEEAKELSEEDFDFSEEEVAEEKSKLKSMYDEKLLKDVEAKLLLRVEEAYRKEVSSECVKENMTKALEEKRASNIEKRALRYEKETRQKKTRSLQLELCKKLDKGMKCLTKDEKASCQYVLTKEDKEDALNRSIQFYNRFGVKLSKSEKKECMSLSDIQTQLVEVSVKEKVAAYKELLTPEVLMLKAMETELDNNLEVRSFLRSGHTTPKKDFNKKLYDERHIVPTFVALKDGSWKMTYTVANNSAMLRYMEKEYGVIQDGRQISFKGSSDDAKESEVSKKINNVSWTCAVEGKYRLHEKAIKLSFSGAKHLSTLESYIKGCGIFACNIETGSLRQVKDRSQLLEGERAYIIGDWTQSGEKAYKIMAYELEENEIFEIFNKLTNEAFSKAYEAGMKVKSSRYTSVVAPSSVKAGNLTEILKETKNYALFLKAPLDSVREIDESLADLLDLSKEGPDGAFYMSELLTDTILREISGKDYSTKTVAKTNMQMRMGLNALKGFGITVDANDMDLFAKKLKERFHDLFEIVGDPNGKCMFIADSNACKILNSANGITGDMDMYVLGIPATSEQVHLSTQIYINLQDLVNRNELDELICDMVEMEVDRRRRNFVKSNKFIANSCQIHQALIAALGPKAIHTNIARKALLRELSQMAIKIADKGSVPLQGISEKVTCDAFNALTNGAVQNVLGFADGYMEVYSPYAEEKGMRYGVMKKFPAQGTVEFVMVKFLRMSEVIGNVDRALDFSGYEGEDRKEIRMAVIRFMRNLGYGTLMVPASALMKECLAGMDFDYDGVTVYTEPFIVKALRDKLGKYAMKVCAIRYSGAKSDAKLGSMVREAASESGLKHVKGSFTQEEADNLHIEAESILEKLSKHKRMTMEAVFGSVIGKTVSASDLAVTIDTDFYFNGKNDSSKLNALGRVIFGKVFPNLGKNDGDKGDYKTIFAIANDNFYDTEMTFASNDYKAAVEIYKVDKDTVNLFIEAMRNTDVESLTLDGYRKMSYELSFVARALGESAIDILKKGSEVDLGFRIEEIVNSRNKKLSSLIKRVDDNFYKWIRPALYNEADEENSMFRFVFDERIHNLEGFLLRGEEFPVDPECYNKLSSLSKEDKEKALNSLVVIDKFGLLKLKMLKRLEAKINAIAEDFRDDKDTISGASLIEKATSVYNDCFVSLENSLFDKLRAKANSSTTNKVVRDQAHKKAEELVNAAMGSVNAILNGVRSFMLDSNVEKHLKDLVRKAIIHQLNAVFGSVVELDAKTLVMLSTYAYMHKYFFNRGVRNDIASVVEESMRPSKFNSDIRWKSDAKASERLIDNGFNVIFKVFGALTGYLWGDHLYATLDVTRLPEFRSSRVSHQDAIYGVHYDDVLEEYVATMNGVDCCTVSVPEGIELFDSSVDNVRLVIEKRLNRDGSVEGYTELLITELHADISSLSEGKSVKPIILDRYIGTDDNVLCCAEPISAPNITNPEYNETAEKEGFTFLSDHFETVLGGKYTPVKESKYFKEEEVIDEETGEVLTTKLVVDYGLQNNEVVGKRVEMLSYKPENNFYKTREVFIDGRHVGNSIFSGAKIEGTVSQLIGNILIIEQ